MYIFYVNKAMSLEFHEISHNDINILSIDH